MVFIVEEKKMEKTNRPLPSSKRSSLDIIESILKSIPPSGIRKTHLANAALLDYKVMEKYLSMLLNENMVIYNDGRVYITKRGIEFLRQYSKIKENFFKEKGTLS
jgi:predicted transcriptional regulator